MQNFQQAEGAAVFLISLRAGGFGLNLTAASYVVLCDLWWNPAVENQAIDRTHRIGQTNHVIAYRLLVKESIEEKIRTLQRSKSALDIGKLWRSEADMKAHMPGIFIGQFLVALAFTMMWSRIALGGAGLPCAIAFGVCFGLFYSGGTVIQNAVQPLPAGLMMKWIISGILQSVLVGVVLFLVHKPAKGCPDISGK